MRELSRLGREQLATGGLLRRIDRAGVALELYLENRELVVGGALDKGMLTLRAMGD